MLVLQTTRVWTGGMTLLCMLLVTLIGCGAAPVLTPESETAEDAAQRSVVTNDTGQQGPNPTLKPGEIPPGDIDGNGQVDEADLNAFVTRFDEVFGTGADNPTFDKALDMNGDDLISWADLQLFLELVG